MLAFVQVLVGRVPSLRQGVGLFLDSVCVRFVKVSPIKEIFFHRPTRCVLSAYTSPRPSTVSGSEKKKPAFELRSQNMNILSGVGRTRLSASCSLTKGISFPIFSSVRDLRLQLDQILIHVVCVNPPLVQSQSSGCYISSSTSSLMKTSSLQSKRRGHYYDPIRETNGQVYPLPIPRI